jgi:rubrerythrin
VHSADVPYNDLLPSMFRMNAGYFLIQLKSERNHDQVYRDIAASSRKDANGVKHEDGGRQARCPLVLAVLGHSIESLPDTWRCPDCRAPKAEFVPVDEWR